MKKASTNPAASSKFRSVRYENNKLTYTIGTTEFVIDTKANTIYSQVKGIQGSSGTVVDGQYSLKETLHNPHIGMLEASPA